MLIALLLWVALTAPPPARAQTDTPAYWRYDAPGRIDHLLSTDLDGDGFAEFLVGTQNDALALVNGDGSLAWQHSLSGTLVAVTTAYSVEAGAHHAVGLTDRALVLISAAGETVRTITLRRTSAPTAVLPLDANGDGVDELLIVFEHGLIVLLNQAGDEVWRNTGNEDVRFAADPLALVVPDGGDGRPAVVFGYFSTERFSRLRLVNAFGEQVWQRAVEGRIGALTSAPFTTARPPTIAVGTTRGRVELFRLDGQRDWYRTLNRPISALAFGHLPDDGPVLYVGTSVGKLAAFSADGRRVWDRNFSTLPDRTIAGIAAPPAGSLPQQSPAVIVTLGETDTAVSELAEVHLLDDNARTIERYRARSVPGLAQLVDSNGDGANEIVFVQFGTLELLAPPTDSRKSLEDWDNPYRLNANPTVALAADLDFDGADDLVIGTQSGQLHRIQIDGSASWIVPIDGEITHLIHVADTDPDGVSLVVAYNSLLPAPPEPQPVSYLQFRRSDSRELWQSPALPGRVLYVLLYDDGSDGPLVIAATSEQELVAFDLAGNPLWQRDLLARIGYLTLLRHNDQTLVAIATDGRISLFQPDGEEVYTLYRGQLDNFVLEASQATEVCQSPVDALRVLVTHSLGSDVCYGMSASDLEAVVGQPATPPLQVGDHRFVLAAGNVLRRYSAESAPEEAVIEDEQENVTSQHVDDFTGDGTPDLVFGDSSGSVSLYAGEGSSAARLVDLSSRVFYVTGMRQARYLVPSLLVVTENGLVRLYSSQPNYAPLLTRIAVQSSPTQYNFNVSVFDVEEDQVTVDLEVFDPERNAWRREPQRVTSGRGDLFWVVSAPASGTDLLYRFVISDSAHSARLERQAPAPLVTPPLRFLNWLAPLMLTSALLAVGWLAWRQRRRPAYQAQRFYRHLMRDAYPDSLRLLEARYNATAGDAEFLLNFAASARQDGNRHLASLGDGLFLLADQPEASIPILQSTLETAVQRKIRWQDREQWLLRFSTVAGLLQSPTITELSLRRPELARLIAVLRDDAVAEAARDVALFEELLRVLDSMRDSERVETADDRLFYLNEGAALLRRLEQPLAEMPDTVNVMLARALHARWLGVTAAAIESLRGRAHIDVQLKTRRVVPGPQTTVALTLVNSGRASAEEVRVTLQEDPSYVVHSSQQVIPILTPGRTQTVTFELTPPDAERFRVAFTIQYDDRQRQRKTFDYADQINVLTPSVDFKPVSNPYAPGTPLRKNSSMFFGREDLFDFIAQEANRLSQQKVLILVGQRRTGKTSALLRLEQHLPPSLIPVYIDCQSLGIVPGIAAFFQDLAWILAETLEGRGIAVSVPDVAAIGHNPAHWFEKSFLPDLRRQLPEDTTLLLVFDEFEAFESLVNDGILPPTLLTYLRYLMQHGEGLSFVFTGTRRLEEMTTNYWSVFFNIALYKQIDFLSREAAVQLITEPVAPNLVYDDLAVDKLLRITAGHPYFLQLVCYTLVKRANANRSNYVTISDVNAAVAEMLRLGEVHFAFLWDRSSTTERVILTAVTHLLDKEYPFRPIQLVQALAPFGIRLEPAEVTAGLNRLVERDIMDEITVEGTSMYALKIGLVGLWVEQNKSLSRLYDDVMAVAG